MLNATFNLLSPFVLDLGTNYKMYLLNGHADVKSLQKKRTEAITHFPSVEI